MMTGYLLSPAGKKWQLPPPVARKLTRTGSVPCDSLEVTCLWEGEIDTRLSEAYRLILEENGERRFTGVVDECELTWSEAGSLLTVSGRGLAALLLDNETQGQDYQTATVEDILRGHVTPYGIKAGNIGTLPTVPNFSASAGDSEWSVLYSFAKYHGGVEPRFDVYGVLHIDGGESGRIFQINDNTGILGLGWRDKRYGVTSEILVRDRGNLQPQRVVNEKFTAQGGCCRRVMTMPAKSAYEAMRYSGEYQLAQSYAERFRMTVSLPLGYACEPGDRVRFALSKPSLAGEWRVLETESVLDGKGERVTLTLGEL